MTEYKRIESAAELTDLEFQNMTITERVLLRQECLLWTRHAMRVWGVTAQRITPKLLKGRRMVIHTGRSSDTLDHAELLRSILAMKYPNEAVRPTFCIRCFRNLPEGKLLCGRCGYWNGEVRSEPMYVGSLMGDS